MNDPDSQFFTQWPDRHAHIRLPRQVLVRTRQRATYYEPENEREFRTLGGHDPKRRRIILWRVPADNPAYDPKQPPILKIPFLAFADEEIADRDDVLLPIVHEIMSDAAMKYGSA